MLLNKRLEKVLQKEGYQQRQALMKLQLLRRMVLYQVLIRITSIGWNIKINA
jgi:hypothetical protein